MSSNIKIILKNQFPNLNDNDLNWLVNSTDEIIKQLSFWFNFELDAKFWIFITQNKNGRDIIAITYLLLPFLNEPDKLSKIYSFKDITTTKQDNKYLLSQMQYDICKLTFDNEIKGEEQDLSLEMLEINKKLLFQTIELISNKLYVNWYQTLPIKWDDKLIDLKINISKHDTYNIIFHNFYIDILDCKWLVYDVYFNDRVISYYTLFKNMNLIRQDEKIWLLLSDTEQVIYGDTWNRLINDNNFNVILKTMAYNIVIYKHYDLIDPYNMIKKLIKEDEDDEESTVDIYKLKSIFQSFEVGYIYHFILECYQKFKRTWYYESIERNKSDILAVDENENHLFLTHKNVFNFCKSMVHGIAGSSFIAYNPYYIALSPELKKVFDERLNLSTTTWLNISANIRRNYHKYLDTKKGNDFNKEVNKINIWIQNTAQKNIKLYILQCMTKYGLLSKIQFSQDFPYISKKDLTEYEQDCYYYINNKTYPLQFLKDLSSTMKWTDNYAVDWISQIHFYHRYIHKNVILVTGATGVGKSTQVPKLLWYGLKMIDHKQGKIICSVPRINVCRDNAGTISSQLGYPVFDKDDNPTENYYLQYQYSNGKHSIDNNTFLKLVTDGLLIQNLFKDPYLGKDRNKNNIRSSTYDIVIIDEAHEHNTNMDMILTLMRNCLIQNQSIKLIIISATIDDDEPIYRKFYRLINDNSCYPNNLELRSQKLDRKYVDRRIHISPPNEGTKFKIIEKYIPIELINEQTNKIDIELICNKVLEILYQHNTGNVLVFLPSASDIDNAIKILNQKSASNILCLSFYSKMMDDLKNKISKNVNKLLLEWNTNKNNSNESIPKGSYNRAIIISTNIAEASVTIEGLTVVIDTGISKVNIYDPLFDKDKLETKFISNTSATQRKGRVGRIGDGYVYYLYKKEDVMNNKTIYNITQTDFKDTIFKMLRENKNSTGDTDIFSYKIDNEYYGLNDESALWKHNKYKLYENGFDSETINDNKGIFYLIHPDEIFIERDLLTNKIINLKKNDLFEILIDYQNELFTYNKQSKNIIKSLKIDLFWKKLIPMNTIIPLVKVDPLKHFGFNGETLTLVNVDPISYVKSNNGKELYAMYMELSEYFEKDFKLFLWYYYSNNDVKDIILFICICIANLPRLEDWTYEPNIVYSMASNKGEIYYLYLLFKSFKQLFPNLTSFIPYLDNTKIDIKSDDYKYKIQLLINIDPLLINDKKIKVNLLKEHNNEINKYVYTYKKRFDGWILQNLLKGNAFIVIIQTYYKALYQVKYLNIKEERINKNLSIINENTEFDRCITALLRAYGTNLFTVSGFDIYDFVSGYKLNKDKNKKYLKGVYYCYVESPDEQMINWTLIVRINHVIQVCAINFLLLENISEIKDKIPNIIKYVNVRKLEYNDTDMINYINKLL